MTYEKLFQQTAGYNNLLYMLHLPHFAYFIAFYIQNADVEGYKISEILRVDLFVCYSPKLHYNLLLN